MQPPTHKKNETNFDSVLSREGTFSVKYDHRKEVFGTEKVLPLWVADMDFSTPSFIIKALKKRLEHPILGYTCADEACYQAVIDWQARHNYQVHAQDILWTHNVANGFYLAVQTVTQPGDAILVQPPVYPPFFKAGGLDGRRVIEAPLILNNNRYEIDFDFFETQIKQHSVKCFLLCNPQNPSGRVWQKHELEKLAQICLAHKVIIVSDEIHSDLVMAGRHCPIASLSPEVAQQTITLNSPGKTFNLGGLQMGYAMIANVTLRQQYQDILNSVAIDGLNIMGYEALKAAYSSQGVAYCQALQPYLKQNLNLLESFLMQALPAVKIMPVEASFLVWMDFRALFKQQKTLKNWLINDAQLGLNDGESFGGQSQAGTGFMRMNIAVPTSVMKQVIKQLQKAISRDLCMSGVRDKNERKFV